MKKIKLILATLVVVLATVFSGGKALAYDITVDGDDASNFNSYQIFTGTLGEDGALGQVEWGNGITKEGQDALTAKYGVSTAAELAEKMAKFTADETAEFAKEAGKYPGTAGALTGLSAGYYLVKNKTVGSNGTYSNYIMEVVKDVTVSPKTGVPTVEKKVDDKDDSTTAEDATVWEDSADYDINDEVPFQLTATLPENIATYNQYYLEFADTLSAGLTYNANSLHIFAVNGSEEKEITGFFYAKESAGNLKIAISDLKGIDNIGYATINKDTKIVVRYSATLNENAEIGAKGNPNTVKLVFSNNPNNSGDGKTTPETPDQPDKPKEDEPDKPDDTNETPEDKVIVFTYQSVVNKTDEKGNELKGAGFTLSKKLADGSWKVVEKIVAGEQTTFTFKGIDAGAYKLEETDVPAGYNKAADIEFTITATHSQGAEPELLTLTSSNNKVEADKTSGKLTTKVENKKGSILPSTGSVGTTMLYVVGTMLVLGAGVLLITKKRMDVK